MAPKAADKATQSKSATPPWLASLGLPPINGRPLYQYRLEDTAFEELEDDLRSLGRGLFSAQDSGTAARFVLWASEWFRRYYAGTGMSWSSLGSALGVKGEWQEWKEITDAGLRRWRIPELRIRGKHYRLAAIARQGGFPVAAIEGNSARWSQRFLQGIVGSLLAETNVTLEIADTLAERWMYLVPETWRSDEIRLVSAELVAQVVTFRRRAETAGLADGALASVWLDVHYPSWRQELPVRISGVAGKALVDGLMSTALPRYGTGIFGVERRLLISASERREQVELKLSGELRTEGNVSVAGISSSDWNRLRLAPSGDFARFVSGELATVEPDERGTWIAYQSQHRAVFDLPPTISVTVELRGSGQRVGEPFVLPGGKSLTAAVRVYSGNQMPTQDSETLLVLLGSGSGGYRPEKLVVDVALDWVCRGAGDGASCVAQAFGRTSERRLWAVSGAAILTSPAGDEYLVRAGQTANTKDRLTLIARYAKGVEEIKSLLPVLLGVPAPRFSEGGRDRAPAAGEFWWRKRGDRDWRSDTKAVRPGICEFAWRDARTRHIRSTEAAVILPANFEVSTQRKGEFFELTIAGWLGAIEVQGGIELGNGSWRLSNRESFSPSGLLRLSDGDEVLELHVRLPHASALYDWNGAVVPRKAKLSLTNLHQYVARCNGRQELFARLLDRDRRQVAQATTSWTLEDELPLLAVRDDIAALLRPQGDIDASVELHFNDATKSWYVQEFEQKLQREGNGWISSEPCVDTGVFMTGRPLVAPSEEHRFGAYGLTTDLNHRPYKLPPLNGNWIIYLRTDDKVLSRPQLVTSGRGDGVMSDMLAAAISIPDRSLRHSELRKIADEALENPQELRKLARQITQLVISLNGLPPSTFDVLTMLPDKKLLSVSLLFQAAPEEVEPLMRLSEGLPLEWCLIPAEVWQNAAAMEGEFLFSVIPDNPTLVAEFFSARRRKIAEQEPALAPLFNLKTEGIALIAAANAFLNRSHDQIRALPDPFRPRLKSFLREWPFDHEFWPVLDAPVAATLAVRNLISLEPAEVTCIKLINRRYPRWFREAFHASWVGDRKHG